MRPSLVRRVGSAYRRWPIWARVGGAAVVVAMVFAIGIASHPRLETTVGPAVESGPTNSLDAQVGLPTATTATTTKTMTATTTTATTTTATAEAKTTVASTSLVETTWPENPLIEVALSIVQVTRVVDGDTLDVSDGSRVRLIGIDTPERYECGYAQATAHLERLVLGHEAVLVKGARDDVDRYGRLLAYVEVDGVDANLEMILSGYAIARYDSRDGYGRHEREDIYVHADNASPSPDVCTEPGPPPVSDGAGTDPRFATCKQAISNGYGPYVSGADVEYSWYRDSDKDGTVCER
jgi:endonuclease YncB( thermonuclease family)